MRRIFIFMAAVAGVLFTPAVAHADAVALAVAGTCQVSQHNTSILDAELTAYQFVQQSDTTYGITGTLSGTCPVVDEFGQPTGDLIAFGPVQVTFAGTQVQLDCFSHSFYIMAGSAAEPPGVDAGNGVTLFFLNGVGTTLTGTTNKQQKAICSTKAKLEKSPPTDVKSTANYVQLLNSLLAEF